MDKQPTKDPGKQQAMKNHGGRNPLLEVSTHAGVAKIFMKDKDKCISKAPKETLTCSGNTDLEFRKAKETDFMKEIQKTIEEQVAAERGHVRLGKDSLSELARTEIIGKRLHDTAEHEGIKQENRFAVGQQKLTTWRLLRKAGQGPDGVPHFHFYSSFNLEFRKRVFKLFQQAARKVVIRCRANRRLVCLRELMKNYGFVEEAEKSDDISPKNVFTFSFPIFSWQEEPFSTGDLDKLTVPPVDSNVTVRVPFFKLEVPQHYQLMGYQPVSTWEAFTSYIPTELARPLRTENPADNEEEDSMAAEEKEEANERVDVLPQTHEVEGDSEIPNTNETSGTDSMVEES